MKKLRIKLLLKRLVRAWKVNNIDKANACFVELEKLVKFSEQDYDKMSYGCGEEIIDLIKSRAQIQ